MAIFRDSQYSRGITCQKPKFVYRRLDFASPHRTYKDLFISCCGLRDAPLEEAQPRAPPRRKRPQRHHRPSRKEHAMSKPADYIVKDISLAAFGRKEIDLAETEMP